MKKRALLIVMMAVGILSSQAALAGDPGPFPPPVPIKTNAVIVSTAL
ncbi:hypothetical protein [Deinococcus misasensis]|nr:hypothetical protein [Deinococcus misasensis]